MAQWVYVEHNKIQGQYDLLPSRWRNISGLDLSADDLPFLKSLGWYPVTKQATEHDSDHHVTGFDYVLRDNDVLEIEIIGLRPYSVPDPMAPTNRKNNFMQQLRQQRNQKLSESDWTQLVDVQNSWNHDDKLAWATYRQALRDITQQYQHTDFCRIDQVVWPSPNC
jgi:hypothetical protein